MIGRRTATAGALAALLPASSRAQAAWPTKPIRLIVPYGPGGSADQVARLYAERLSAALGQQVIVEDKPGASGGVGAAMVAASAPDGYTLPARADRDPGDHARRCGKVPYEPDDLVAVCRLSTALLPVTITNALGAKSWQEFVALAKANPGQYWFGSSGLGTITHLTGEVLTRAAGIKMQHAPYKTIVDATGDIFDGRIQMVFDPSFVPYAKAGKVRTVLIDAPTRLADLPDMPTAQRGRARPEGLPRPDLVRPVRAQGHCRRPSPSASPTRSRRHRRHSRT